MVKVESIGILFFFPHPAGKIMKPTSIVTAKIESNLFFENIPRSFNLFFSVS